MSDDTEQQLALPAVAGSAGHGTMLDLRQVADRLGVSLSTVRKAVRQGSYDGAELVQGANGQQWLVPLATVESLLAHQAGQDRRSNDRARQTRETSDQVAELQVQLAELRGQLAVANALAAERALQLDQLHQSLRTVALTVGQQAEQQQRRRWLRR